MPLYKLKINSVEKTEALLQEVYDDAQRQLNLIQSLMNELKESTSLVDEIIENKTKFAKAMNDFSVSKDKAIGRKMEVAKVLAEILKHGGNVEKVLGEDEIYKKLDLNDEMQKIREQAINYSPDDSQPKTEEYITNVSKPFNAKK